VFPSSFDYVAARSVEEAVAAKREGGDDVRFLAGGQSLIPMMKTRLATPAKLVEGVSRRADDLGRYLRTSDANQILDDAEGIARRNPWLTALAGAAAGFAASRFLKASSGRRYDRRPLTGAGTRSV